MWSNPFFLVLKREYLQRVRGIAFLLSTIVFPLLMGALIFVPVILSEKTQSEMKITVIDEGGAFYSLLSREVDRSKLPINLQSSPEFDKASLNERVLKKELDGYLVVPGDVIESGKVTYYGRNVANAVGLSKLHSVVNRAVIAARLLQHGIDPDQAAKITSRVHFDTFKVSKSGEKRDKGASFLMVFLLFLTLYMIILLYGASILRSVLEEKSTRIVEVLVSSIKPFQLMMGKIMGIAAVGFTQYLVWFLIGLGLFIFVVPQMAITAGMGVPTIPLSHALFFLLFFIIGYLMYATLYAAVGAIFNTEQEAQQLSIIIIIPLIIPMLLMQMILQDPSGTLSVVLSLVPLFTPLILYLRILVETPPAWQIILGLLLSTGTVVLFTWLAGKIYRVGILMTGKRPTFREIFRWLKS